MGAEEYIFGLTPVYLTHEFHQKLDNYYLRGLRYFVNPALLPELPYPSGSYSRDYFTRKYIGIRRRLSNSQLKKHLPLDEIVSRHILDSDEVMKGTPFARLCNMAYPYNKEIPHSCLLFVIASMSELSNNQIVVESSERLPNIEVFHASTAWLPEPANMAAAVLIPAWRYAIPNREHLAFNQDPLTA